MKRFGELVTGESRDFHSMQNATMQSSRLRVACLSTTSVRTKRKINMNKAEPREAAQPSVRQSLAPEDGSRH